MHNQWEELIPFYIANTLPPKQRQALESHLATCAMCRASLEQWRAIAGAVKEEASAQGRGLPPLSPQVRHTVSTQRPRPDSALFKRPAPTWRPTYVAAAAAAAILIAAGVLAVLMSQAQHGPTRQGSSVAALFTPTGTRGTPQSTANATLSATRGSDFGIVTPTILFINTPLPTRTALPTVTSVKMGEESTPFPTQMPTTAANLNPANLTLSSCTVTSTSGDSVAAMRQADVASGIAGYLPPNDPRSVIVAVGGGWYEIFLFDVATVGWVSDTTVTLSGDCSSVPQPTATLSLEQSGLCYVTSARGTNVNIFAGPGTSYAILTSFGRDDRPAALDTSDNGWYRITLWVGAQMWNGWVPAADISTGGDCSHLGMIPAAGYLPDHAPVETPTLPAFIITPTAGYGSSVGTGSFSYILAISSGQIPAGTRVAISSSFYDGTIWHYGVYTQDGLSADDVLESQLTLDIATSTPS